MSKDEGWQKVTVGEMVDTWNFDENKEIVGTLTQSLKHIGENDSNIYVIDTEIGEFKVWGNKVLDGALATVLPGSAIKIVYLGKQKGSKYWYKNFDVFVKTAKVDEEVRQLQERAQEKARQVKEAKEDKEEVNPSEIPF